MPVCLCDACVRLSDSRKVTERDVTATYECVRVNHACLYYPGLASLFFVVEQKGTVFATHQLVIQFDQKILRVFKRAGDLSQYLK